MRGLLGCLAIAAALKVGWETLYGVSVSSNAVVTHLLYGLFSR